MRHLSTRSMLRLPVLVITVTGAFRPLGATEKHWIAHEAQVIVVGTLTKTATYPWVDGWHVTGVIRVEETLYGGTVPRQINFLFVCRWNSLCQWWPPPKLPSMFKERGLWFLRRA